MGLYCHISVIFACDGYDGISDLAAKHMAALGAENRSLDGDSRRPAISMLRSLAEKRGVNIGHKGGLFAWGVVGNYVRAEEFVDLIKPFLLDLYQAKNTRSDVCDGPLDFEHVLVFFEQEQRERAKAFEISFDENTGELSVKEHDCPFAWMQM